MLSAGWVMSECRGYLCGRNPDLGVVLMRCLRRETRLFADRSDPQTPPRKGLTETHVLRDFPRDFGRCPSDSPAYLGCLLVAGDMGCTNFLAAV